MIEMICGSTRTADGLKKADSGAFSLSAAAEKRLVERGVAQYVAQAAEAPESKASGAAAKSAPAKAGGSKASSKSAKKPTGKSAKTAASKAPVISAEEPEV